MAKIPAGSKAGIVLQNESESLWREFENLSEQLNPRGLVNAIHRPCKKLREKNGSIAAFVKGLSQSLPSRAAAQNDYFAEVQTYACCVVSLLEYLDVEEGVEDAITELILEFSDLLQSTLETCRDVLANDRYAILSTRGGPSDLYFLPLRISKLLGWAAANSYIGSCISHNEQESASVLEQLVKIAIDEFLFSLVVVSDRQSPYTMCMMSELQRIDCNDYLEIIFGCLFNDYLKNRGLIARTHISPGKIPEFLLRRNSKNEKGAREIYAQPDEFLSVMFRVADQMRIDDVVDPYLENLDHHSFNVFIPSDHTKFVAPSIKNGVNLSFQVGYEYGLGVFNTADFRGYWENHCVGLLNQEPPRTLNTKKIMVILASLIFPDRVAWLSFE